MAEKKQGCFLNYQIGAEDWRLRKSTDLDLVSKLNRLIHLLI